ncbi:hypothetical protein FOXB_06345, partial [Fusarium oxysporum f. sp. conglutinans Fo5176]
MATSTGRRARRRHEDSSLSAIFISGIWLSHRQFHVTQTHALGLLPASRVLVIFK